MTLAANSAIGTHLNEWIARMKYLDISHNNETKDRLLSIDDVASLAHISTKTASKLIDKTHKAIHIGRRKYVLESTLFAYFGETEGCREQ